MQRIFANRGDGWPLTERGRAEAATLARRLAGTGVDLVLTSPLRRARETAASIAAATQAPMLVSDGLRECDMGDLEGTGDAAGWALHEAIQAGWAAGDLDRRPPGGESLGEVMARLSTTLDAVPPGAHAVLVGHGSLLTAALPRLLSGVSPQAAATRSLGHTEVVEAVGSRGAWRCRSWAGQQPPLSE